MFSGCLALEKCIGAGAPGVGLQWWKLLGMLTRIGTGHSARPSANGNGGKNWWRAPGPASSFKAPIVSTIKRRPDRRDPRPTKVETTGGMRAGQRRFAPNPSTYGYSPRGCSHCNQGGKHWWAPQDSLFKAGTNSFHLYPQGP